jgi:hypothetical protein
VSTMSGCQRVSRLSRDQRADGTLVLSVSISTRRKLTSILLAVTIFALLAGLTSFATRGSGPITGTEGSNLACSSGESYKPRSLRQFRADLEIVRYWDLAATERIAGGRRPSYPIRRQLEAE